MTDLRYPALTLEEMTPEQRSVHDDISAGPRGGLRGPFIALLHNAPLARQLQGLGEHLRFNTGLADTLVELAILVAARHWNCGYEWYAHERLARKAGLAPAIIEAINLGRVPSAMSPQEAIVHAVCTEALRAGAPSDGAFDEASAAFGKSAVLDLLALCGYYSLLALVLNTARPPIPDGDGLPLAAASKSTAGQA